MFRKFSRPASLAAGDRVTVVNSDGRSASGVLVGISAGVLRLRDGSRTTELALQDAEVQYRPRIGRTL